MSIKLDKKISIEKLPANNTEEQQQRNVTRYAWGHSEKQTWFITKTKNVPSKVVNYCSYYCVKNRMSKYSPKILTHL